LQDALKNRDIESIQMEEYRRANGEDKFLVVVDHSSASDKVSCSDRKVNREGRQLSMVQGSMQDKLKEECVEVQNESFADGCMEVVGEGWYLSKYDVVSATLNTKGNQMQNFGKENHCMNLASIPKLVS